MENRQPMLSVKNLWKVFGPKAESIIGSPDADLSRPEMLEKTGCIAAVKDVSFDVAPGEVFVVMGLSGSGKSTLVRCLTRLIEPTAGKVELSDRDVAAMSPKELMEVRRNEVAMVFQHFGLLPHRRVLDNVAFGLEVRGEDKDKRYERSKEVIDLVGLKGYENHYPDQLSGGMQQRVGLARALAVGPKLLLFDEPFSALDPLIRRDMQNEVIRLQEDLDTTMVFITHDLQEALKLGDRILIMRDGEVVQIGRPDEVIGAPADEYVRDFVQEVPRSHVLTLRWVMRPPRKGDDLKGPEMDCDTIVQNAARAALDSDHPVRVTENGELVGIVDDEAILRTVVAEESPGQPGVGMSTLTREPEADQEAAETPKTSSTRGMPHRGWLLLGVLAVWVLLAIVFQGKQTLVIGGADQIGIQNWLGDRATDLAQSSGGLVTAVTGVTGAITDVLNAVVQWLQLLISAPAFPSPYPHIGFLGVLAVAWFATALVAGWRMSVLTAVCFALFALLGFYADSMDLLVVTFVAVALSVGIGLPLAIWMAHSSRVRAVLTPVLDLMQTLPSFAYLLPAVVLFHIGAASAIICTLIYSLPPVMRISAHGLQNLPASAMEATESMGQTAWQRLVKVELPMAKRTIIVGINQTTMAALSMATIAAFINGPGLGQPVVRALNALRVGDAFVPGLCIVLMAIMLDRVTTAASEHSEKLNRGQARDMASRRTNLLLGGAAVAIVCVYLSRHYTFAAKPWSSTWGDHLASLVQTIIDWISLHWSGATTAIANGFTDTVINKLQYVLAGAPWFVTGLAILALAVLLGGRKAGIATIICLLGLRWLELWNDAMITLTATIVATVVVMVLAALVGVWMGRSGRVDQVIRPLLDAGQTLPPFVYLIPVLALFGATRFTAIVAAIVYAAPPAIKIVADGIKAVSATTVEAAESAGAITIQIITKVQIPMARSAFTVAANQGLLYVLAMVVIGGLVGAGALGYDVVAGFKQLPVQGRGLAAGLSIVLLGVMLDRITTYAARRAEGRS